MSGYAKLPLTSGNEIAEEVSFDNSGTDLTSTNVQDAIVEVYNATSPSSRYIFTFNNGSDWTSNGGFYEITIPASTHGKGSSPNCKIYENISSVYHEVLTSVMMDSNGNLTIQVSQIPDNRFSGKLTVQ